MNREVVCKSKVKKYESGSAGVLNRSFLFRLKKTSFGHSVLFLRANT